MTHKFLSLNNSDAPKNQFRSNVNNQVVNSRTGLLFFTLIGTDICATARVTPLVAFRLIARQLFRPAISNHPA